MPFEHLFGLFSHQSINFTAREGAFLGIAPFLTRRNPVFWDFGPFS